VTIVDSSWLEETLLALARTPTSVPPGHTAVDPGDPAILSAMDGVIVPMLEALEPDELRRHASGEVAARFGPDTPDGLLLQTYLISQHGDPGHAPSDTTTTEAVVDGRVERTVIGPGTRQNKGAMAAAFDAVRRRPRDLARPVWLTVNAEGRSSHGGSSRILDGLGVHAAQGVIVIATGSSVSLGNRGRVDLVVTVPGISAHSSQPWLGENPIERAADAVVAIREAPLPEPDAVLGAAAYTPYRIVASPIAPHTLPSRVEIAVDRRLLPGERPAEAASAFRRFASERLPFPVEIAESVSMLPALVASDAPVVLAFEHALGESRAMYSLNTFDAGYACAAGIPTVMFGPGRRDFGSGLTEAESITLAECDEASDALLAVLTELCG
jgi:acetylornithine deacetylase/succinyl-diaminopimelate desuccinylase-like protein